MKDRQLLQTSFGRFAESYDTTMGNNGDYFHQNTLDPALFSLIGKAKGKKIYDCAGGNGYISRRLIKEGAKEAWASDISKELISIAETKYPTYKIKYLVRDATNFSGVPKNYFDIIIMNMAIFYVEDIPKLLRGISQSLKLGGRFIFSADHPLKYSGYKAIGRKVNILAENKKYLKIRKENSYNSWTGKRDLQIYLRPLGYYINSCAKNNLLVSSIIEPETKIIDRGEKIKINIPFKAIIETTKI